MGFLDSLKSWLARETTELKEVKGNVESRLDRGLTERERRLSETPNEAIERLQEEISDHQGSFDSIEDKIANTQATADAHAEMAAADAASDPDILDLESEELEDP